MGYGGFKPYVPVAKRREKIAMHIKKLNKKGVVLRPVIIEGRSISKTFWGKAWCKNLESYSDFENRLPRGRSYVRNGSVIDLQLEKGRVAAQVMGSSLYTVGINIRPVAHNAWTALVTECSGKIDSLIELLQGKLSKAVMALFTKKENGLFPNPSEIQMHCSCPDHAYMCKHVAATLYAVGAFLDEHPELLFTLRHVSHLDLLSKIASKEVLGANQPTGVQVLEDGDLSALFGVELAGN